MSDNGAITIEATNARDALFAAADTIWQFGEEVSPRGLLTKELQHATILVHDPEDWHCVGINASWSAKIVALEALQLIGGFSDTQLVGHVAPRLLNFTDDGVFEGAYGPRMIASLEAVVQRIKDDPDTRQAIIPIWNADDANRPTSHDYPCTLTIGFYLREGRLNCHVTMRSNDVNWGLKHDLSQFMLLQCSVANLLSVSPGKYYHTAYSLHMYETSFDWYAGLSRESSDYDKTFTTIPRGGIVGITTTGMMHRAWQLAHNVEPFLDETPIETWLRTQLA